MRQFLIYLYLILATVGFFTIPLTVIAYSFLGSVILYHLLQLISHDYFSHEYIVPRNSMVKGFILLLWATQSGETIKQKKNFHYAHHLHWKNVDKDPTARKLKDTTWWEYLLEINVSSKHLSLPVYATPTLDGKLIQLHEKHCKTIWYSWIAMTIIFMPWWMFMVVSIYPKVYGLFLSRFHDYYFHGGKNEGKDSAWLLPLYGSASWHIKHHKSWRNSFYGFTKFEKYLNLGWYFNNIFFKPNVKYVYQ